MSHQACQAWGIRIAGSRYPNIAGRRYPNWVTSLGDEGILAYRSVDDAAHAIAEQARKLGETEGAEPCELPAGLHGVWMPSRGSESSSIGEWLGPANQDGVPAALVFTGRERAQRLIETLQSRPDDDRISADACVRPFSWAGPVEPAATDQPHATEGA